MGLAEREIIFLFPPSIAKPRVVVVDCVISQFEHVIGNEVSRESLPENFHLTSDRRAIEILLVHELVVHKQLHVQFRQNIFYFVKFLLASFWIIIKDRARINSDNG